MSCAAIRWIAATCLPAALSCSGPTAVGPAHPPAPATSGQAAGTPPNTVYLRRDRDETGRGGGQDARATGGPGILPGASTQTTKGAKYTVLGTPPAPTPAPGKVTRIQLDTFFPLQQAGAALIYDVRPGFSFRRGHIPHAISWPKGQFTTQLAAREAEIRAARAARRPVIVYCTDLACPDSNKIATRLAARGHSVSILDGGYAAWTSAELPCE